MVKTEKKASRKAIRIIGFTLLSLLVLLVLVGVLLLLPSVQTFIAKKATAILQEKTGSKISIGKVAIRLPDVVQLQDIYAEDPDKDTLLYAGTLKVNIQLWGLLKQKVTIENVLLENAVVNLHQNLNDSTFNFQYLIDAFSSGTTQPKDTTPSAWIISVNNVELNNVRADVDLAVSGFKASGLLGNFSVDADKFDLANQEIDFANISLNNSRIALALAPGDSIVKKQIVDSTTVQKYLIPAVGWTFKAGTIDFANNSISFDNNAQDTLPQGVDFSHLHLTNLNIKIENALYADNTVKADIKNILAHDKSGLQLKQFEGNVTIDSSGITVEKLKAKTNNSEIENSTVIKFPDLNSLQQLEKNISVDAVFNKSHISVQDILLFVPQLANNKSFNLKAVDSLFLDGNISGTIGDLTGKDFILSLGKQATAHLNFTAKGLPDIDNSYFNLNIEELTATPAIVSSIIKQQLPEEVVRLGKTTLKGKYIGTIHKMDFDGTVSTQLGNLSADLKAQFNKNYTDASYEGKVNLNDFQLGTMLGDTTIGKISLEAAIKGSGLTIDSLQADLEATIKQAVYRNYNYKDIAVNGNLDKKKFTGKLNIDDENLRFDFSGLVDLNDSLPAFEFDATLDTVNLGALNLVKNNVGIHADIEVDFRGLTLDDFDGTAAIRNIRFSDSVSTYLMDSITARTYNEGPRNKIIEVASPILNAKVGGDFNAADLPKLLVNYVNDYFPISVAVDSVDKPPRLAIEPGKPTIADQKFEMLITVSRPLKLIKMFVPEVTRFDTAYIVGKFDSKEKSLQLDAAVPGLEYGEFKVDSVHLIALGDKNSLMVSASVENVNYKQKTNIPNAKLAFDMANDNMDVSLGVGGDSIRRLGLGAHVTRQGSGAFRVALEDTLHINGEKWAVPNDNYTDYNKGYLSFHNVRLDNKGQELSLTSPRDSVGDAVKIGFKNFSLHELSDFADYNEIKLEGDINGSVVLKDIYTQFSFVADIAIDSIIANDNTVGNLVLKAEQQGSDIAVNLNLEGGGNQLVVAGKFLPASSSLDLDVDINRLNLNSADPFLQDFISQSKGYISADLTVKGEFVAPEINGKITFHDISTKSVFANSRFTITNNSVAVSSDRITLDHFEILDEKNRPAAINGFLTHKKFRDIQLDLSLKTNEFQFMNTKENKNGLFYGTVVLAINGTVKGPATVPRVEARASTKPGTKVFILPLAAESEVKREDFVLFGSPPYDNIENVDSITLVKKQEYNVNYSGVDLNLAFELTPDAQLQIIIDPISGDSLTCYGSANLLVDIPPAGTPQITGTYIVEKGNYSNRKLLKKRFEINKGSRIDFIGNPMRARLDISAKYITQATTYDLISAQSASLSDSEAEAAKKRTTVYVILNIKGDLATPELSFDIEIPDNDVVSSTAARRLQVIRGDPNELNKQAFYLLMFDNFIAEESSSPNLGGAGENLVLRSMSNLVNSQLNRLANKVEGFEINLDVGSYKTKYETASGNDVLTQVGLDISQKFIDDRLQITLGGNVNVENTTSGQSTQNGFSNVSGDFTIEYKLTKEGKYRVKVYQTSDFDILNQSNVYRTGVGLTYRESFGEIFKKKKKKKSANP